MQSTEVNQIENMEKWCFFNYDTSIFDKNGKHYVCMSWKLTFIFFEYHSHKLSSMHIFNNIYDQCKINGTTSIKIKLTLDKSLGGLS